MNPQYNFITSLSKLVAENGGKAYLVGGFVRDMIWYKLIPEDMRQKEIDIEVFGIDGDKLYSLLQAFGVVNTVGASFVVYKLRVDNTEIDVSLPRRESKSGKGHRGFIIEGDPHMSVAEASSRRDFRMNSMYYDPLTKEIIDSHGGLDDLKNKVVRHINESFRDDPLRVLRGARFAARLGFSIAPETVEMCRGIDLLELSKERIRNEFYKIFSYDYPNIGMYTLSEIGVFSKLFGLSELDNKNLSYFEPFYKLAHTLRNKDAEYKIAAMFALSAVISDTPDKAISALVSNLDAHSLNNADIRQISNNLVKSYNLSNIIKKAHFGDAVPQSYFDIKYSVLYRISRFCDMELLENLLFVTDKISAYREFFSYYNTNKPKLSVSPILNGNDLIGKVEDKKIGEALHLAYEKQLDEDNQISKEKLIEYINFMYNHK